MPKVNFPEPPLTGNAVLDRYLLEVHSVIFGVGGLSGTLDSVNNVLASSVFAVAHSTSTGTQLPASVGAANINWGSGAGQVDTDDVPQGSVNKYFPGAGAAVSNGLASAVNVGAADADAVYDAAEAALLNEVKGDVNALVGNFNALVTQVNALLTSLRNAGLISA